MRLSDVATRNREVIWAVTNLLVIYDVISNQADKDKVKPLVTVNLRYYSDKFDGEIKYVNGLISLTKLPGVATDAVSLREDLSETKNLLDSHK